MAITFRHDAAAVVPPSNSSTRKYGQSLVLQQQQQKYAAQQAGYDRMFQAYRDENQNIAQQQRDWQQRDFVLNRDRDQNKLMQEQQRRADFANARQRMDAYAKETLNNPDLPPQLRNKIQNLIAGKMTVLGSDYNETQQQEFLDQYNAELAKLLSEAPVPKEPPTRDEQLRSFLGDSYEQYKDEPWVFDGKGGFTTDKNIQQRRQMEQKQEQDRLLKQQQELEQMRPKTMQEYYGKDDDKYRKDLRSTMDQMQKDYDIDPNSPKPTRENAVKKMQEDYDLSQRELGRSQYGEPTLAPPLPQMPGTPANQPPTQASAPAMPGDAQSLQSGEMKSILEEDPAITSARDAYHKEMTSKGFKLITPPDGSKPYWYHDGGRPDPTAPTAAPTMPGDAQQPGEMKSILEDPEDAYRKEMTRRGFKLVTPPDGSKPYWYHDGGIQSSEPTPAPPIQTSRVPYSPERSTQASANPVMTSRVPYSPGDGGFADIAAKDVTPPSQPVPAPNQVPMNSSKMQANTQASSQVAPPDFNALMSGAKNDMEKQAFQSMKTAYQSQSPDVQSAIAVLLNPSSSDRDAANALAYLKSKGIDPAKMATKPSNTYGPFDPNELSTLSMM